MGSSTASDTTTNTSTDSSNTVYTMVTVTDAEQEERQEGGDLLDGKNVKKDEKLTGKGKDNLEFKRELKDQSRRMDKKQDTRARDILNEFDELFLENEKRINADRNSKGKGLRNGVKLRQEVTENTRKGSTENEFKMSSNAIVEMDEGIKNKSVEKESDEPEEQRHPKINNQEEIFQRAVGSSSEKESDDIFTSTEEPRGSGSGTSPPTPHTGEIQKDDNFFTKTVVIDEETLRNIELALENNSPDSILKSEKPKSNIRTIQSELPQRTITSNFNKRKNAGDQEETRKSQLELNKMSPKYPQKSPSKSTESTVFPFPPRSTSPKAISKSSSPKLKRDISNSLKKLVDISSPIKMVMNDKEEQDSSGTLEPAPLTLSNLEKHEKSMSQEFKHHQPKFESIFNMDSPTTLKSSSLISNYLNPTANNTSKFEFPSCTSPTENNNGFEPNDSDNSNREIENSTSPNKHINEVKDEKKSTDNQTRVSSNKRQKRSERKSISAESPIKLNEGDDETMQNRLSKEIYDAMLEEKFGSRQNRKYSILTTDGSIKNFVSENSEEFKKTNENLNKENINRKKSGNRRASECPQRHRRVSIIQGESLRHFIFEEPDTSKMKPNKQRKVSMVSEDTTRNVLLEGICKRKSSLIPGDTLRNLLGDDGARKAFIAPDDKPRKFSINTLGDIVSARKFSLLPPGEIYTSQIDGKTTEIIKLAPGTKGRPLATIVVQQASIQRGSISGPSGQKEDTLLDVANTFTLEELHEFDMKYGSPHHCRSQSVKTPGRSCGHPNYLCLPQQRSRVASMPNTGVEEEYYRLRHFSITGKGVVNRGDSLKSRRSRSNNSVASSNSSHR
ncbi:hypothetical protein RUM43_013086 [Polyplax serrata]|uniref:Uncharacterized protein n=1 Tax=Polyplax serrata TaxID=468196 RepID=A0AAN8S002_POLSC